MNFTLSRNDTQAAMTLPQGMSWCVEFGWSATAQTAPVYTLSGALVIQQGQKRAGRPVTLAGEWAWLDLGIVRTLRDWSDVPELTMTLTHYDGRTFNVLFRLHDTALPTVSPVAYRTPERADDRYTAEICLITV